MKDSRAFEFARDMAEMSHFWRQRVGCVIVYKKKIISTGINSSKTHPLQKEYNRFRYPDDNTPHYIHAEIHALMQLRNTDIDWSKVKLYVYRIKKNESNGCGCARPCPACMEYIKDLGIKHIYYTTSDSLVHEVLDIN